MNDIKTQYPVLLERLSNFYAANSDTYGAGVDEAIMMIRESGIIDSLTTISLLDEAGYGASNDAGTVMDYLRSITPIKPRAEPIIEKIQPDHQCK